MRMNRVFFVLIILAATHSLQAQFSVGVRQGFGTHGIYLEPPTLEEFQADFWLPNTAFVIVFNNKLNTGLQMEFSRAQKGWREEDTVPNAYFSRKINYLEIPIFSHFEIGKGAVRTVINAGPYLAFKLSEEIENVSFSHYEDYDHYHQKIKDIDFGIKVGVGLRYNINRHMAIFGEARYDIQIAGGRDIFTDQPNGIQASRLREMGGTFGVLWHIIPQEKKKEKKGYIPKENLYESE